MTSTADHIVVTLKWELTLRSPAAALWPLVSDTNRMNMLAGMPTASFSETREPGGRTRRWGSGRLLGMPVRWEEHPFRWVYGEGFEVERSFENGPLSHYRSSVSLRPLGPQGTRLVHQVDLTPATAVFKPLVHLEGGKLARRWSRAYELVDGWLSSGGEHPFVLARKQAPNDHVRALAAAIAARGQDPALVERLVAHLLGAHDLEVQHLRPFVLADQWSRPRLELLELCLVAAGEGLLLPVWNHLCPLCRGVKASVHERDRLAAEATCSSCDMSFGGGSETTELAFRPHPRVREVEERLYCVGGPGATPHVLYRSELPPNGEALVSLAVEPGTYRLRGPRQAGHATVIYGNPGYPQPVTGEVLASAHGIEIPAHPLAGPTLRLQLRNQDAQPLPLVIERAAWADDVVTCDFLATVPVFEGLLAGMEGL